MSELGNSLAKYLKAREEVIVKDARLRGKMVRWGGRWQYGENTPAGTAVIYIDKVMVSLTDAEKPEPHEGAKGWALMVELTRMRVRDAAWVDGAVPYIDSVSNPLASTLVNMGVREMQKKALRTTVSGVSRWMGIFHWKNSYKPNDMVAYNHGLYIATTGEGVPSHSDGWDMLDYVAFGGITPQPPPDVCTVKVTVGEHGTEYGFQVSLFGDCDPEYGDISGLLYYEISVNAGSDLMTLRFGDAGDERPDPLVLAAEIDIEDFGIVGIAWNDVDKAYYSVTATPGLGEFMTDRLDKTVCMRLDGVHSLGFYAATNDRTTFEMIEQGIGLGVPEFIHSMPMYAPDYEGVQREFAVNEPVWSGGRVVRNHCYDTDNLSNSSNWQVGNATSVRGATDPDGGDSAYTLTATDAGGYLQQTIGWVNGNTANNTLWVRRRTGSGQISLRVGSNLVDITTAVTGEWQRIASGIGVRPSTALYYNLTLAVSGDAVDVWHPQCEDVTGQVNQNPGEYVPNGSSVYLSTATKIFALTNGNQVVDNVVTELPGVAIDPPPKLVAQKDEARNDIFDSNNLTSGGSTAWFSVSAGTGVQDAVGLTGEPNTATTCNGSGATSRIYQNKTVVDAQYNCAVARIKKDAVSTREVGVYLDYATNVVMALLRTDTGAVQLQLDTGTNRAEVVDDGDWWKLIVEGLSDSTACVVNYYPARAGTTEDSVVGNIEFHLNKTIDDVRDLGPIFTEDVPVPTGPLLPTYAAANHEDLQSGYVLEIDYAGDLGNILTVDDNMLSVVDLGSGPVLQLSDGTNATSLPIEPGTHQVGIAYGGTPSPELVDVHPVTADNWTAIGTNLVETSVEDSVKITYVDNVDGAAVTFSDNSSTYGESICDPVMVEGNTYSISCKAKVLPGNNVQINNRITGNHNLIGVTSTEWVDVVFPDLVAKGTANHYMRMRSMGEGEAIWVKDISVKEVLPGKMDLDLDGLWAGEVDYDGFGSGALIQGETAREIKRVSHNYQSARDWVNDQIPQLPVVTYNGALVTYLGEPVIYTPTV